MQEFLCYFVHICCTYIVSCIFLVSAKSFWMEEHCLWRGSLGRVDVNCFESEKSPLLYCLRWNSLCISKVQSMAERFDHESREMESRVAGIVDGSFSSAGFMMAFLLPRLVPMGGDVAVAFAPEVLSPARGDVEGRAGAKAIVCPAQAVLPVLGPGRPVSSGCYRPPWKPVGGSEVLISLFKFKFDCLNMNLII
jgi:hypothetical protein